MKKTRTNPYTQLLNEITSFCSKLKYRHTVPMFFWSMENLQADKCWRLDDVYHRTMAAQSLGYEVIIKADEKGMQMEYKKKIETPLRFES